MLRESEDLARKLVRLVSGENAQYPSFQGTLEQYDTF